MFKINLRSKWDKYSSLLKKKITKQKQSLLDRLWLSERNQQLLNCTEFNEIEASAVIDGQTNINISFYKLYCIPCSITINLTAIEFLEMITWIDIKSYFHFVRSKDSLVLALLIVQICI